jgi:outer membrane protein
MSRWLALGALLLASSPIAAFAEEVKLGYVDLQRALNETEDGRKAKASLKKVFDQKQKELNEQQDALKKDIEDLDKKRTLLPADKLRDKEAELQSRLQKVQQTYVRHQQDLQTKEQEATAKIFERMNRIINKIAVAENFSMILDKNQSAVIYAKAHLDLTNELIRRYNGGEGADKPAGGTAAAPKPAAGGGGTTAAAKK